MYSFLGGSGLFISKKASKEQQEYGWELLKSMIDMASTYALVQRSPPPYDVRSFSWRTAGDEAEVPYFCISGVLHVPRTLYLVGNQRCI